MGLILTLIVVLHLTIILELELEITKLDFLVIMIVQVKIVTHLKDHSRIFQKPLTQVMF